VTALPPTTRKVLASGHCGAHLCRRGHPLCRDDLVSFRIERWRATFEVILLFLNPIENDFQIREREDKIEFKKVLIIAFVQKILFEGVKK
jgi:hypothetical protein